MTKVTKAENGAITIREKRFGYAVIFNSNAHDEHSTAAVEREALRYAAYYNNHKTLLAAIDQFANIAANNQAALDAGTASICIKPVTVQYVSRPYTAEDYETYKKQLIAQKSVIAITQNGLAEEGIDDYIKDCIAKDLNIGTEFEQYAAPRSLHFSDLVLLDFGPNKTVAVHKSGHNTVELDQLEEAGPSYQTAGEGLNTHYKKEPCVIIGQAAEAAEQLNNEGGTICLCSSFFSFSEPAVEKSQITSLLEKETKETSLQAGKIQNYQAVIQKAL